ncbi:hypothetical protein [Neoroseomonas oryzicola]|uniref:Uncharacterized protein n=1 Tax=Neoroseomonas oryzicola TaxID=535904 RepID=A0A9X9WIP4_9PROT|nr:hypothetical protein [Neoroseomonas oryzicola]MBR0660204.1 hypothetical protein [Neoroseomonas oryzicola]NKE16721.1 hypothetical protein [Neoroseomonas oryzicola]
MSESARTFVVTNEDEAFALLERLLAEEPHVAALEGPPRIDLKGWPKIEIYLPETPVEGSISPTMMAAFIELQTSVYRAYMLLNAETGDLRSLTRAEREHLEFRVVVTKGSSEYSAALGKVIENIGASVVAKMSSTEILIAILGVALICGGVTALRAWLTSRVDLRKVELEERKVDAEKGERTAFLDAQRALLEHNIKQTAILAQAVSRVPILGDVEAAVDSARQQMVKAIGDEEGGTVQGVKISPDLASEVTAQRRQQGTPITFTGIYRVSKVDTTVQDGFRVTFTDVENDREVTATLQDALISGDHRSAIQEAEWSKRPIKVRLSARLLRSRYVDAVVLNVEPLPLPPIDARSGLVDLE